MQMSLVALAPRSRVALACGVASLVLAHALGCAASDFDFITNAFRDDQTSGDMYPIGVDLKSGAVMFQVEPTDGTSSPMPAVFDILAPISIRDQGVATVVQRRDTKLRVLGKRPSTGAFDLPRATLTVTLTDLHPCAAEDCTVGRAGTEAAYQSIIAGDAIAQEAVRMRLGEASLWLLPEIAPSDNATAAAQCDAVFAAPFRGGGTMVLGGTEVSFVGRRIALNACAEPNPRADIPLAASQRGTDLLLVASTGVGPTLLSATAYQRIANAQPMYPALATLPEVTVTLASGPVTGRKARIAKLTLAGNSSEGRGACRDAYAHHLLSERECQAGEDCPCLDRANCGAPGILELAPPGGFEVVVLADETPLLQGLRAELRATQAEVDGVLGTQALLNTEFDVDYANARVLARCVDAGCLTRPSFASTSERGPILHCLQP